MGPSILWGESAEVDAAGDRPSDMLQLAPEAEKADTLQRKLAETRVAVYRPLTTLKWVPVAVEPPTLCSRNRSRPT